MAATHHPYLCNNKIVYKQQAAKTGTALTGGIFNQT